MKKTITSCMLLFICCNIFAQYQKANVFTKEGRTYGLGTHYYAFGDGRKGVLGFDISFGREEDGKRLFYWWEFRFIPSYTFSYNTTDDVGDPATVSGSSKLQIVYAVNWGYYLLNNEGEQKFKPYVTAGFNIRALGGYKDYNDNGSYGVAKLPEEGGLNVGIGGGAGAIVELGGAFSIKLEGGYTYQHLFKSIENTSIYGMLPPSPYGSLGLRFKLVQK